MENKYIFLRIDNKEMFFKNIKNANIQKFYLLKKSNIIFKILRKMNLLRLILGTWIFDIKKYNYCIMSENEYIPEISKIVKKKNKNCKTIMYFWNIINENEKYKKILEDNNIDEFWTFDKNDAKKYNMKFNPQFYNDKIKIDKEETKFDFLFLGRPKDRKQELQNLENILKDKGYSTNFKIIENEKDYIPYGEYLKLVAKSKCIIDYNQKGQVGLSLRPMEALFFNKKLLTNNSDIKNYDFYCKSNIFVLNEDNINQIINFMKEPYQSIELSIVNYYNIDSWIKRFFIEK